jgi:hypothetical protein
MNRPYDGFPQGRCVRMRLLSPQHWFYI